MALLPKPVAAAHPALLVTAALALVLAFSLVRTWRSPLSRIPGTPSSLFTSAALRWHEMRGERTRYVHALHQRYGPVVRLTPSEVSFSSAAAVKEIYNTAGSGYDKTDFYNLFTIYGRRTMFTTLGKEQHARRRRILADRYANSNVMRAPSLAGIEERARRFVDLCVAAPGGVLDIYTALHAYAFDCVTHHLFHPYGADSLRNEADADIMREATFDDSLQNRLISWYSPALYAVAGRIVALFTSPRDTPLSNNFVLDTSARTDTAAFTLTARMHEKQQPYENGPPSLADAESRGYPQKPGFDLLDAAAESLDHMAAGIDTTGDGLCFLMYELSLPRSRHFQERLRRELRDNKDGDNAAFDRLPFLDAVVMEGLRCFPAIPMSLPRLVPSAHWGSSRAAATAGSASASGAGPGQGCDGRVIDGYFVPTGTVVSSQAYSVHRMDASVFPDPDTFNPDRWLAPDGDAERRRNFFAFASGGRGCIGKHLALVEMKLLLRDVYTRFATTPDAATTPEAMIMADQLISARPLGQSCLLHFTPVDDTTS
nr:cytochrome P450 [Leptographium qinlingense (nom. inval.)]